MECNLLGSYLIEFDECLVGGLGRHVAHIEQRLACDVAQRLEELYLEYLDIERGVQALAEAQCRVEQTLHFGVVAFARYPLDDVANGAILEAFEHEELKLRVDEVETRHDVQLAALLLFPTNTQ